MNMKTILLLLAFCASTVYCGVVDTTSCGGTGTWRELRIDTCQGELCEMVPGTPYSVEADFIPSAASPELCLNVTAIHLGFDIPIISTELPGSSVQPGQLYTIRYTITPNDSLKGFTVPITSTVGRCFNSAFVEMCRSIRVRIL